MTKISEADVADVLDLEIEICQNAGMSSEFMSGLRHARSVLHLINAFGIASYIKKVLGREIKRRKDGNEKEI